MYDNGNIPETRKMMGAVSLEAVARDLLKQATTGDLITTIKRLVRGERRPGLYNLADVLKQIDVMCREPIGATNVSLVDIMGTAGPGRAQDFDRDFRPLRSHNRDRWLGVAAAWLSGRRLPPVDLIQVGDVYFVQDGHHRISVARALGERQIYASVVRLSTCDLLPWQAAGRTEAIQPRGRMEPAVV